MQQLAKQGFVVLASQYRGNDGGEGHEQLGGQDSKDVLSFAKYRQISAVYRQKKRLHVWRLTGGMMTFIALKRGIAINAAAVVGAVYDVTAFRERAPELVDNAARLIPDYSQKGLSALRERSVLNWPEAVNVPLLMIHGTDDDEVPVTEALAFTIKLSNLKKTYGLMVYAGDVHEAAKNRADRDGRIAAWFKSYMR